MSSRPLSLRTPAARPAAARPRPPPGARCRRRSSSMLCWHVACRLSFDCRAVGRLFAFRAPRESCHAGGDVMPSRLSSRPRTLVRAEGPAVFSACVPEFLADDAAKRGFQRLLGAANVLPKGVVDQALIVAAAGPVHLLPKPVENVVIKPDGNSSLALWHRHDGAAFCVAEVVFTFHCFPRIAAPREGLLAVRR